MKRSVRLLCLLLAVLLCFGVLTIFFVSAEDSKDTNDTRISVNISKKFDKDKVNSSIKRLYDKRIEDNCNKYIVTNYSDLIDGTYSKDTVSRREWVKMMMSVFEPGRKFSLSDESEYTFYKDFEYAYDNYMIDETKYRLNPYIRLLRRDAGDSIVPYLDYEIHDYDCNDYGDMEIQTNLRTLIYYGYFNVDKDGNGSPYTPVLTEDLVRCKKDLTKVYKLRYKSMLCFGDSIMEGGGNEGYGIPEMLCDKYKMKAENYGVSAATFGYIKNRTQICLELYPPHKNGETADFILLNGGTNDQDFEFFGTFKEDDFDFVKNGNKTFIQGMEFTIGKIKDFWPESKFLYIRAQNTGAVDEEKERLYGDTAIKICDKWKVTSVDLYNLSSFDPNNQDMLDSYTKYDYSKEQHDGIHPNYLGYIKFYLPYITDAMVKQLDTR